MNLNTTTPTRISSLTHLTNAPLKQQPYKRGFTSASALPRDLVETANYTVTEGHLDFTNDGLAKNLNLHKGTSAVRGVAMRFRDFNLMSLFMRNDRGKARARIELTNDYDRDELANIHKSVVIAMTQKFGEMVGMREPASNSIIEIGFPMGTVGGERVPKYIAVESNGLTEQVTLDRANDILRNLVPHTVDGNLNIWCKKNEVDGEESIIGGYYFTVEKFSY